MEEFLPQPKNVARVKTEVVSVPEKITAEEIRRKIEDSKDEIHIRINYIVGSFTAGNPRYIDDRKDLSQEVSLKIFNSADSFSGKSDLYSWIYRIAQNTFRDYLRRRKSSRVHITDSIEGLSQDNPNLLPSSRLSPSEKEIIGQMGAKSLIDSIRGLSEKDRKLLELKFFEDFSNEEIAEELKIPEGTVKSTLSRILQKIRDAKKIKTKEQIIKGIQLSTQQKKVLQLLPTGKSFKEIADFLQIPLASVHTCYYLIADKLSVLRDRDKMVEKARELNLLD